MDEKDISAEEQVPAVEQESEKEKGKGKTKETLASLKKALEEEKVKTGDYLANWQRSQADFINYKRRTEQEREEVVKFANATLMLSLLPVLDDLERALENVSDKLAGMTWVEGVELIYRKLRAILEASGLSEIKAVGETFDPNLHEAVMEVEGDEGKVVEELQKGYKLHDRVLRPTMVKVGRGRGQKPAPEEAGVENQQEAQEESNG
jgi:molecular chaperone GrpE